MRVAVMADIHGFSLALESVLEDIGEHGPFDHILVAGDLCEGGPAPEVVIERLRCLRIQCVQGNTDRDIAEGSRRSERDRWTRERIGHEGIAYLRDLPFDLRIKTSPQAADESDLLIVHANPVDLDRHLRPEASEREIIELIGGVPAAAIAFGHLHIPYQRYVGAYQLIDVSSVGNPKDGDLRCAWGLIEWDLESHSWTAQVRRIPYPIDETVAQIRESGIPDPERLIASLKRASY